ncbi:MAG: alpha-ketoacid dehydrogenase subunit beta, partial [Mesorhizobium sp.]
MIDMRTDAQILATTPDAYVQMTYLEALVQAQMEEMD